MVHSFREWAMSIQEIYTFLFYKGFQFSIFAYK